MIRANDSAPREAAPESREAAQDALVAGLFPPEVLATASPLSAGSADLLPAERPAVSDSVPLRRQCFKEIWGSGVGEREKGLLQAQAAFLNEVFPRIDRGIDRHLVLEVADVLRSEFAHYCVFADIHDSLEGESLDPGQLAGWAADNELARPRYECRDRLGRRGDAVVRFTEGGCGSMYLAGMRLAGRGELDDRIARACEEVYRDEVGHMRSGIVELGLTALSEAEWEEIAAAIRSILLQRLHMRNEQFGFPVTDDRIRAIEAGEIEPMKLDGIGLQGLTNYQERRARHGTDHERQGEDPHGAERPGARSRSALHPRHQ